MNVSWELVVSARKALLGAAANKFVRQQGHWNNVGASNTFTLLVVAD